jgi:DNA-binding NtrC family response regulator
MNRSLFEVLSNLARAAGAPRVLCADDDPDVRALCASGLTKAGYATDMATNGREVLEKLQDNEYSVILLDLGMPAVHGATVLSLVQRERPDILRRIIIVTGMPDAVVAGVPEQVAAVIHKPVTIEALIAEVNRCSSKGKRRRVENDATARIES